MIDQPTIDRILDAAQIYDVVSDFVTLRKRGVNYVGLCPFHDDKNPFLLCIPRQRALQVFCLRKKEEMQCIFIMEHEQMSYPEALKYLAKKYGIEIKERELSSEEKIAQGERESLFIVNNFARDYFQNILKNHVDGRSIGMAYFRSRGFRDDIIEKFQLGYCTESHDALAQEALKKGYEKGLSCQDRPLLRDGRPPTARPLLGARHLSGTHSLRQGGGFWGTCACRRHQRRQGEVRQLA